MNPKVPILGSMETLSVEEMETTVSPSDKLIEMDSMMFGMGSSCLQST